MLDMYFRVSEVFQSSDSDDSRGQANFKQPLHRDSTSEFGSIFKTACDELRAGASNTHQNRVMSLQSMNYTSRALMH